MTAVHIDCDRKKKVRNDSEACAKDCPEDHPEGGLVLMGLEADIHYFWYLIQNGCFCRAIIFRAVCSMLLFFSLLSTYLFRRRKNNVTKKA